MKLVNLILIMLSSVTIVIGQQDIILSKYSFNSMFFNPAYAGSTDKDQGSVVINYRDQWVGLEGSPTSILIGAETNLFDDKVGLGLNLAKESIGVDDRIDLQGNYSYRLDLGESYLCLGIRAAYHHFNSKLSNIEYTDPGDLILDQGDITFSAFSAGVGVYYYQDNFYGGVSMPALMAVNKENSAFKSRHLYFHTGAIFDIYEDSDLQLEPSLLLKYDFSAPVQLTVGVQLWFIKDLAVGLHYRSSDALGLSMEFIINDRLTIGAAYDFATNELRNEHSNTLEFLAAYKFGYAESSMFNK